MTKKDLRQRLRDVLHAISPETLHERSVRACRLFLAQTEYARAETVLIFLSTPTEVDTSHIALQGWADGKRILAPKVSWDQRRMLPIEINSLTTGVQAGVLGVREPVDGMPIPVGDIDLVVVPGLAFDARGNRLGRGRGFYDRFLAHRDFRALTCALALEEQFVPAVPVESCDVKMQMLVTDSVVRRF